MKPYFSTTHSLTTEYAKNYCNRTTDVQVIVENVVTCFFFLRHSVLCNPKSKAFRSFHRQESLIIRTTHMHITSANQSPLLR